MDETSLGRHFAFGENWANFANRLTPSQIEQAERGLTDLVGVENIRGKSFLDIGCGSGLASLAALRLGASRIHAIDIDPVSVSTTLQVLRQHAPDQPWHVEVGSILDLPAAAAGTFDVVYSWGVLYHTGSMWRAIDSALQFVSPGGIFAVALYRKTPFCPAWRQIKRIYTHGAPAFRTPIRVLYRAAFSAGLLLTGRSPGSYAREYEANRGMSWATDIEDWLGGYPYESVEPEELVTRLTARGLVLSKSVIERPRLAGFLGSRCDEYLFRRVAS